MRRNSHGMFGRLVALATLLAVALTLLFGSIASANTTATARSVSSVPPLCISATPLTQVTGLRQTAWVTVSVNCLPATSSKYVWVRWGDGTIEYYPITFCQEVCHVPPILVDTSHAYTSVGAYHPIFCVVPSLITTSTECTTTQIQVVALDPPVPPVS